MKEIKIILLMLVITVLMTGCGKDKENEAAKDDKELVLRVCNWEEYIDEGDWDDDELIELDNGKEIIGINPMYEEFEEWYYKTYGIKVRVEYSCFGTNEDLYNQLTIGDRFDLVCPSDYMIMKLMAESKLVPFSDAFFDKSVEENYYVKGVSPYIKAVFDENEINGEAWSKYSAGYMWGTTGLVYNPLEITDEEASHWKLLVDEKYKRRVTIKDNVRDSYFAALAIYKEDKLLSKEFLEKDNYEQAFAEEMNDASDEVIDGVEAVLRKIKDNAYSFETDSGKADMVTGKVLANYQWSGDAVYTIEQAEEDDVELRYQVPEEGGNLWFDGWVMLKDGISEDSRKQHAAEAFINYLSIPENVVRNMYYIGYTSVISGEKDDSTMFDYANWYFAAEDDAEDTIDYDISYFFEGKDAKEGDYVITAEAGQEFGALGSQYPTLDIIRRCAVMGYFGDETNDKLNQMWINVRCFNPF